MLNFDPLAGPVTNLDAGLTPQSDIGDYVWIDTNSDGIQNANESGVPNITVNLHNAADNAILATAVTAANGEYLFENQTVGTYYITYVNGTDFLFTTEGQGDGSNDSEADPNATNGQTADFVFDPLTGDDLDHDAGLIPIADIGNFVWIDSDRDGIQDLTEIGQLGITVNLRDANTGIIVASDVTLVNGDYRFLDVQPGDYYIEFDLSTIPGVGTYEFSPVNQGNTSNDSDPNMSSGNTPVFTFDPLTGDDLSIDAGIYPTSTIGNYVWLDENGDGIQTGENGIAGVTVLLYDSNTGLPLDTVITDAMGAYEFSGVPSGDYYVVFDGSTSNDIDDFVYSPSGAGTAATGSDVDASGQTASFSF